MIAARINGLDVSVEQGSSILSAVSQAGIELPSLCHDPRLKPYGACRLCMVKANGRAVAACTTELLEGDTIETHPSDIEAQRRTILSLLAENFPPGDGNSQFEMCLDRYDIKPAGKRREQPDESHTYLRVDMDRCIHCNRCVRICDEVQGQFVWQVVGRGELTRIVPDSHGKMADSSCVGCGACVDACPSGALTDQESGKIEHWTRTTCPYCGVGCEMRVGTHNGRIVNIRPALDAPVNRGHLCVKGRYAFHYVTAPDRITRPMIRTNDRWEEVDWEQAIEHAADALTRILDDHGPDSIGILGSARATNEENYVAQKFARAVIGTNNVDCCARVCHAPSAYALREMLGTGAATNSFADIERAETILVCGANPTENHPIVGARIRQRKLNGARLIVIDPRRTELAAIADIHLRPVPGTNIPLFHAIACAIADLGAIDEAFVRERTEDLQTYLAFVRQFSPEKASGICGLPAQDIRRAAELYARHKPAISFHGLGLTEHHQGSETVMSLINLALLTGNIGKPGTGVNPLRGQNNVQGSAHMGCEPNHLTGFAPLLDKADQFEKIWNHPIPRTMGMNLIEMMDAAEHGRLQALWAFGYDILMTNPNVQRTRQALRRIPFIIIQDLFMTETAREFGSVFFPAASSYEKDGTFMNGDRHIQRVRAAIPLQGDSKPDWQPFCDVAKAMGKSVALDYASAEEIWNEIRKVWPGGAGIAYARLDQRSLQWPCPSEEHPGTQIVHKDQFAHGQKARFRCIEYEPTEETTDEDYPILLVTGRTLYQFNAGTMTMRTPNARLRPNDTLDLHPEDASALGLSDGQFAVIKSRRGQIKLAVRITDQVAKGQAFSTFHSAEPLINLLTSDVRDKQTLAPEYKVTAVRVAPA